GGRAHQKLYLRGKLIFRTRREIGKFGGRILSAQACALDTAPSRARRIFAVAFSSHRDSAGHSRQPWWIDWPGNSWLRQHCANDSVSRLAGIACPSSVFRYQRAHCDYGPVPLRVIADRAEYCRSEEHTSELQSRS